MKLHLVGLGLLPSFAFLVLPSPAFPAGSTPGDPLPLPCQGQKVGPDLARESYNFGFCLALREDVAVVGAPKAWFWGYHRTGAGMVFERVGDLWSHTATLVPAGTAQWGTTGQSVALTQDRIYIGNPHESYLGLLSSGATYIFERVGDAWVESAKLVPNDPRVEGFFGMKLAIDGDTAVVGDYNHPQGGASSGAVYVFERGPGGWAQVQRLRPLDLGFSDFFGWSVAVEGEWILAGMSLSDAMGMDSGAAYVYRRTDAGWVEFQKLVAPDGQSLDHFGFSVAISGTRLAVGAYRARHEGVRVGAVYVFDFDGSAWQFTQKVVAPDPVNGARLGISVDLDGDQLLTGANLDPEGIVGSGSAYLFRDQGSGYSFVRKLRAPDASANDFLGVSVALSQGIALVGVWADDHACPWSPDCDSGAAWFFQVPDFAEASCFGQPCPCANADPARGCARGGARGAALAGCGSASASADDLAFAASGLAPGQPAWLFRGSESLGAGLAFGDGLRCAGGAVRRLGTRYAEPDGTLSFGPGLRPLGQWEPGERYHFQLVYRDPHGSACGQLFNSTNAIATLFAP
jgi:hypothetical protein